MSPVAVLTLLSVSGYIVFTNAFMLLVVPGTGVPIGEAVILLNVLSLYFNPRGLRSFFLRWPGLLAMVLWIYASAHLVIGASTYGVWAIRDAAHMIETSYLLIGYSIGTPMFFKFHFVKWFSRTFFTAAVYALAYPFQSQLQPLSPMITSMSGYTIPLFFSYNNVSSNVLTYIAKVAIYTKKARFSAVFFSVVLVSILIGSVQARIVYVQLALLLLLLAAFRPSTAWRYTFILMAGLALLFGMLALQIEIPGRLGQTASLDFLLNHIAAIWGGGGESVSGPIEGIELRQWWFLDVTTRVNATPSSIIFGLGFGVPLTSFISVEGDLVREPHNSFLSVYARMGLLGLSLFLVIQIFIIRSAVKIAWISRGMIRISTVTFPILCFFLLNLLFVISQGGFEKSFVAIPYYFVAGLTMRWLDWLPRVT